MVTRRRTVAALVGATLVVTACNVPTEDSAQRLSPDNVPFQLAETTTTNPDTPTTVAPDALVKVFLVGDDRLEVVTRVTTEATPDSVLALLAQGPTQSELNAGLRTALVPDLARIVSVEGDLITIDLDGEFSAIAPTEQRLAIAQITFAMTQLAALNRVRFLVAGEPASVPRGDGTTTDSPVAAADYSEFAPA